MSLVVYNHPLLTYPRVPSLAYYELLRTYVELDTHYYLDLPYTQGRVRLTNMQTGEYVIYGNRGIHTTDRDLGIDETLGMNVPKGYLRVRVGRTRYQFVDTRHDIDSLGILNKYAVIFTYDNYGDIIYTREAMEVEEVSAMRSIQLQVFAENKFTKEAYASIT
jgi:hypothetical protein